MNDSLYIAATGMQTQQMNVDAIANNLVNVNTPGFKATRVSFQDLVYRGLAHARGADDLLSSSGARQGTGVGVAELSKLFSKGELKKTEAPLDLAIQGDGFFEITQADGSPAYIRGGALQINRDGFLASGDGSPLKPNIYLGSDAKDIVIEPDGKVMARLGAARIASEVGRIELVNFTSPAALEALGQNQYKASERSGEPIYGRPNEEGMGTVAQGFIEASNVKMVDEMVNLMVAQRAYEMSVKVIQASDEMLGMSNNLRR
jgi:flagellar basal-body rod protein FlgG